MKYKNYYNYELGNRDIYSQNDILKMTVQDLFDNELPLSYQYNTIGFPKEDELTISPNTYQYTNANGQTRWRSGMKSTEEMIEEERRRREEMEAQKTAQSQLGWKNQTQELAPKLTNTEVKESPILDSTPLFDQETINNMGSLIKKGKEKFQNRKKLGNDTIADSINDVVFSENPNEMDSPIMQEIEQVLKPSLDKNSSEDLKFDLEALINNQIPENKAANTEIISNAPSPYLLKGEVTKEVMPSNMLERLKNRVKDFADTGFNKEDDLNLKGEIQDRYDKLVNNKTDYSSPMTTKEKLTDKIVQKAFKKVFPASSDIYTDGMTDFSRARNNPNAEVLQNLESMDEATKKALLEYGVSPDERGVYYNSDSEISKKFANSPEVKKFFEDNEEAIRQGKKDGGNFNFDASLKNLVINKDKMDRHASLQHAKMIGAYYDENGNKYGRVIDNVDYERRHVKNILDGTNIINNHGYNMQEKKNFENYYIVMDILLDNSIEESKKKNLLRKILNK